METLGNQKSLDIYIEKFDLFYNTIESMKIPNDFMFPNVSKMETLGNKFSLIRQNKRSNKVVF